MMIASPAARSANQLAQGCYGRCGAWPVEASAEFDLPSDPEEEDFDDDEEEDDDSDRLALDLEWR